MAAALKEKPQERAELVDEDLSKLPHGELFRIVGLEVSSARATQAFEILFAAQAKRDVDAAMQECRRPNMRDVAKIGRATQRSDAKQMREDWRNHLVTILQENALQGKHLSRQLMVDAIRGYNLLRRYKGKNGGQIKRDTITSWLTLELEQEIREEALTSR